MTDDEISKVARDAFTYGTGFMRDGKHVPMENVYMSAKDAATKTLVKRLRNHCFSTDWQVAVADAREAANCIERMEMLLEAGGARHWENRCLELEAALREIADTHIPDQPAAAYGDGEYWARQQHTELRRIARAALGEKKDG